MSTWFLLADVAHLVGCFAWSWSFSAVFIFEAFQITPVDDLWLTYMIFLFGLFLLFPLARQAIFSFSPPLTLIYFPGENHYTGFFFLNSAGETPERMKPPIFRLGGTWWKSQEKSVVVRRQTSKETFEFLRSLIDLRPDLI